MIITLKGADFSANNIGKIIAPRKLNDYTIRAINTCGAQLSNEQKYALDDLFIAMGAGKSNSVLSKVRKLYLPMIAGGLDKAFVNYADTNMVNDKSSLSSSSWEIFNNGLRAIDNKDSFYTTLDNHLLNENFSAYWLRTTPADSTTKDHNILVIDDGTGSNFLGIKHSKIGQDKVSPGSYGWAWVQASNPITYNQYTYPSEVIKTQMVNINGINYQWRNIEKEYIRGCPNIGTSVNNADVQTLYSLQPSNAAYGALMLGEYIEDNDLAFRIADSLDALYAAMKS